ncbi:DUF998 domain-containing protein [Jannaschia rubra]|uniref:DUF998 domain-containing protein n=1 Tax=Jannaschia rubra TaxID=282197 RepID=A0A0M6XNZ6_9RHOB|nr:DUF998 domain-containing protein [Jannaschia rubra]CTQ31744.1 hypothetical protein JAN5088_00503 [Jannaschia rubra]SFG55004.1 Protein of unknown function [Jannaschia rubra]
MPVDPHPFAGPLPEHPHLLRTLGWIALLGPAVFIAMLIVADVVVPDHDWIADTVSDLGAGRYEWIADVGIYAYSAALLACAVGAAHAHLGGRGWTFGIYGLILLGLIVFLIGARNEYGDGDSEGWEIHSYLVWVLGALFAAVPWAMSEGAGRIAPALKWSCRAVTVLWVPLAPPFFIFPTGWDGLYERMLGAITFVFVVSIGFALIGRARAIETRI